MPLSFTNAGKEYTTGKEQKLKSVFAAMEYKSVNDKHDVPMSPAMAIQQIIKEQPGDHTHYAYYHELAPYGLVSVRSEFKNASVNSYWLDDGCALTCLAVDEQYKNEA